MFTISPITALLRGRWQRISPAKAWLRTTSWRSNRAQRWAAGASCEFESISNRKYPPPGSLSCGAYSGSEGLWRPIREIPIQAIRGLNKRIVANALIDGRLVLTSQQGSTDSSAREKPFPGRWPVSKYKGRLCTASNGGPAPAFSGRPRVSPRRSQNRHGKEAPFPATL